MQIDDYLVLGAVYVIGFFGCTALSNIMFRDDEIGLALIVSGAAIYCAVQLIDLWKEYRRDH